MSEIFLTIFWNKFLSNTSLSTILVVQILVILTTFCQQFLSIILVQQFFFDLSKWTFLSTILFEHFYRTFLSNIFVFRYLSHFGSSVWDGDRAVDDIDRQVEVEVLAAAAERVANGDERNAALLPQVVLKNIIVFFS